MRTSAGPVSAVLADVDQLTSDEIRAQAGSTSARLWAADEDAAAGGTTGEPARIDLGGASSHPYVPGALVVGDVYSASGGLWVDLNAAAGSPRSGTNPVGLSAYLRMLAAANGSAHAMRMGGALTVPTGVTVTNAASCRLYDLAPTLEGTGSVTEGDCLRIEGTGGANATTRWAVHQTSSSGWTRWAGPALFQGSTGLYATLAGAPWTSGSGLLTTPAEVDASWAVGHNGQSLWLATPGGVFSVGALAASGGSSVTGVMFELEFIGSIASASGATASTVVLGWQVDPATGTFADVAGSYAERDLAGTGDAGMICVKAVAELREAYGIRLWLASSSDTPTYSLLRGQLTARQLI